MAGTMLMDDAMGGGRPAGGPPDATLIIGIAKLMGMDIIKEPQHLWIAEKAARAELPAEWRELTNADGETMYYNMNSKKMQKVHPVIGDYMRLYHKARSWVKIHMNPDDEANYQRPDVVLSTIIADVMGKASKSEPPATPTIIKGLCDLLGVDHSKEFYLVRVVKQTLEAYIEKRFDLTSYLDDLQEPVGFLREIRKKQNQVDIIRKPTSIVKCQECEKKAAVVKCEQCKDYFCQDCFNSTHATGKRRAHVTSDVEQLVCALYEDRVATCQCIQCGLFYSDEGFLYVHAFDASRPDLRNHLKRVINGLVCMECEHYNASVLCEDCVDLFCTECFIRLHKKGKRRQHVHLTIDNTGQIFRGGFLVSPEEAQVLTDRARSTVESGPCVPFRDEQLNVYWWDFANDRQKKESPVDPVTGMTATIDMDPEVDP